MPVDISEYKVGVVVSLEELSATGAGGKALRLCMINMGGAGGGGGDGNGDGDDDEESLSLLLPIVTSAPNVRQGSRVVVAPAGSTVLTEQGEELILSKTTVGGRASHGMLCDSRMLGWSGGAVGVAVQVPHELEIGTPPPASKPRPKGAGGEEEEQVPSGPVTGGLFERKLTKEEKKKLAAEKRAAKKATKTQKGEDEEGP